MGVNYFINIGNKIKQARTNYGMKQKELAAHLDIPISTLANYENGHREPSKEIIENIAHILNIEVSDLIRNAIPPTYLEPQEYFIEQLIDHLGYKILFDEENGYRVLKNGKTEYEVSPEDIQELFTSTTSFIDFKVQELIKRCRKIGK